MVIIMSLSHIEKENIYSQKTLEIMTEYFSNLLNIKIDICDINIHQHQHYKYGSHQKSMDDLLHLPFKEYQNKKFNIYHFDGENLIFLKNIYNQKENILEYTPENTIFKEYAEKIILLLSTFFKKVNVSYIVSGRFSRFIGLNPFISLNNNFKPSFEIENSCIRIIGTDRIYGDDRDYDIELNYIDFIKDQDNDLIIKNMFNNYNKDVIPEEFEIKIDFNKKIEEIEDQLSLIKMLII